MYIFAKKIKLIFSNNNRLCWGFCLFVLRVCCVHFFEKTTSNIHTIEQWCNHPTFVWVKQNFIYWFFEKLTLEADAAFVSNIKHDIIKTRNTKLYDIGPLFFYFLFLSASKIKI